MDFLVSRVTFIIKCVADYSYLIYKDVSNYIIYIPVVALTLLAQEALFSNPAPKCLDDRRR